MRDNESRANGCKFGLYGAGPGIYSTMQIGIAAYLRNLAVRCNQIARTCDDARTRDALAAISAELAEKAEVLEDNFRIRPTRGPGG